MRPCGDHRLDFCFLILPHVLLLAAFSFFPLFFGFLSAPAITKKKKFRELQGKPEAQHKKGEQ
jgi:hypothetical protein